MALTTEQIITRCYREGNLIPIGKTPTAAEVTETLGVYQSFMASLLGNDIGQLLGDWEMPPSPTSANPSRWPLYPERDLLAQNSREVWRNPPPNVNILTNSGIGSPIYFPPTPSNGARMALVNVGADFVTDPLTISGNGRLIEGAASLTLDAPLTAPILWFYRGDLANWVRVVPLELASESPLPPQFDDFIIASMSIRRGPAYNKEPKEATVATAVHGLKLLKTTYLQSAPGATYHGAWRFNTYQAYGTPWRFSGGGVGGM
jgi:hypothetical protein